MSVEPKIHQKIFLKDLVENDASRRKFDSAVSYGEAMSEESSTICLSKSVLKHVKAVPMPDGLADDIDKRDAYGSPACASR